MHTTAFRSLPSIWRLALTLLSLSPFTAARAQDTRPPVTARTIRFRITEVRYRPDGLVEATLEGGLGSGIETGFDCSAEGVTADSLGARGGQDLGDGKVIRSDSTAAVALIRLSDPSTPNGKLYPGDMVRMKLEERYSLHPTLLSELATRRISLVDEDGEGFYRMWSVLLQDHDTMATRIIRAMVTDLHRTAARVRPTLADSSTLRKPNTAGHYRGRSLIDILEQAREGDVTRFLDFITSWPSKYVGRVLSLGPTLADWAVGEADPGKYTIRDELIAIREDAARAGRIRELDEALSDGIWAGGWNALVGSLAEDGKFEEARRLHHVVEQIVEVYDLTARRGWTHFALGQVEHHARQREAAIAAYRKAILAFQKARDEEGVRFALNNIADQMNLLGRYVDAVAVWDTVAAMEREYTRRDSTAAQHASLAVTLQGYAKALAKIDRYQDALRVYDEAAKQFALAGGLRADARRAAVLHAVAGLYGQQGDRERAIRTYTEAKAIYTRLEDGEGVADELDEIGHQTFQLGNYREAKTAFEEAYRLHVAAGELGDAGYSQSQIGQAEWNLGNYQAAIAAHNEAADLRRKSGDKEGIAYSLGRLATLYRESGDPTRALPIYEQVAALYAELEDPSKQAETLNSMGDVYYNEQDYVRAIGRYHEARGLQERLQTPRNLALTYYDLGDAFWQQDQLDSAGAYYTRSTAIQREIGDEWNLISSLNSLGYVAEFSVRDRRRAEAHYREALALATKLDARNLLAECYTALGRSAFQRGVLDSAMTVRQQALSIYRELGDRKMEAKLLLAIGDIEAQRGELASGLALYQKGYTVAEQASRRIEMATALASISGIHISVGEYGKALAAAEQALAVSREVNNPWGIAQAFLSLGSVANSQGDYQRAAGFYQQADSSYVALNSPLSQSPAINNLGTIHFWQADYPRALAQFQRALEIVKANGAEGQLYPVLLSNIGEVYYEQGNYPDAMRWLGDAERAATAIGAANVLATAALISGKVALARADYSQAERALARTDSIVRKSGARERLAAVLTERGKIAYARKDLGRAGTTLEEAVRIAREIGASKYLWEPLLVLGEVRRDQGDSTPALRLLEESATVLEQLRHKVAGGEGAQKVFASGRVQGRLYEALVSLLIRRGQTERALTVLEQSMNEELRDKFRGLGIQFADSTKARLLAEEERRKARLDGITEELARTRASAEGQHNTQRIAALEKTRGVAEQEYIEFVNQMIRDQPELKNHTRVNIRDLRASKRDLPRDVALVTYLPGERELYIFVLTSDTVSAQVVPVPRDSLNHMVDLLVKLARSPSATLAGVQRSGAAGQAPATRPAGDLRSQAALLYRVLVAPVEKEIATRKRLAIVPSGSLYFVPFQILAATADSTARTLGEERAVFYVTELKVAPPRIGPRPAMRLAAFGNADNSLANAEREVMGLKRMYPTAGIFLRSDATEARAKALPAMYNVVHFATHGNLDYTNFDNSFLTLAPSPNGTEDGKLTLKEVWRLQGFDRRRLVVLSACNTAVSEEQVAGWPNSPATAFLDVGVPAVIASLWPVDDAATAILIAAFYRNMRTMDTAESLRQAQLALRADPKFSHPYYWGAWVLVGDWR